MNDPVARRLWRSGGAIFAVLVGGWPRDGFSHSTTDRVERLIQHAEARRVSSVAELQARFDEDRERWMATLPPDPDIRHPHVGGTLAIRIAVFPAEVIARLPAPANAPLMIRMTLKATNIGDGLLPSTVIAGIPKARVDLDGDTDRNGIIDGNDEDGEDASTRVRGTLITPPLRELQAQGNSIEGLARIRLSALIQTPIEGLTYHLVRVEQPTNVMLHLIERDGKKLSDKQQGEAHELTWDGSQMEIAVMRCYARPLNLNAAPVRFVLDLQAREAANNVLHSDRILLTVAPLIIAPECNPAQQIYTTAIVGIPGTISADAEDAVQWAQDMVKFVYYQIRSDQPPQSCVISLLHTGRGSFTEKLPNEHNHMVCGGPHFRTTDG